MKFILHLNALFKLTPTLIYSMSVLVHSSFNTVLILPTYTGECTLLQLPSVNRAEVNALTS